MKRNFTQFIESHNMVSIYCDSERPASHLTGYIIAFSDEAMLIQHVSKEGRYDGFVLIHPWDVFRIDCGGQYEQKIQMLYTCKNQSHPQFSVGENPYAALLEYCMREELCVSIELADCMITGFLSQYDGDCIRLRTLDPYGVPSGESFVQCEEIRSFAVDTSVEQDVRLLFLTKNNVF